MKYILILSLSIFSMSVCAGSVPGGLITKMMVDTSHGEKIFIQVSGNLTNTPPCNTNGMWQFVLPLDTDLKKETMTSFLLSAHMAGKKVRLDGNNTCDSYPSIETLKRIEFIE